MHAWSIAHAIPYQATIHVYSSLSLCRSPCLKKTSVKIIKNEVRCRDDTMPKTVDTRRHCKVGLRACNNLPQPPPYIFGFCGLQKIVAYSQPYLAVPSCVYSFWHGIVPTSYFIFSDFYTCNIYKYKNEVGCRDDTVPKTVDTRRHCEEE